MYLDSHSDKLSLKVKKIDLEAGGTYVVVLNKKLAEKCGIKSTDRALIKKGKNYLKTILLFQIVIVKFVML